MEKSRSRALKKRCISVRAKYCKDVTPLLRSFSHADAPNWCRNQRHNFLLKFFKTRQFNFCFFRVGAMDILPSGRLDKNCRQFVRGYEVTSCTSQGKLVGSPAGVGRCGGKKDSRTMAVRPFQQFLRQRAGRYEAEEQPLKSGASEANSPAPVVLFTKRAAIII
jgi:hypothetical protein